MNFLKSILLSIIIILSFVCIIVEKRYCNFVSKIEYYNNYYAKIRIAKGSQISLNNLNQIKPNNVENKNIEYENQNLVTLKINDISAPHNIDKIETKISDNSIIVSFDKPEDNGTNYSYLIKNSQKNKKEKNYNFYSESGIKGFFYEINNQNENIVKSKLYRFDECPIILNGIDWNKDYFLHIKTIDNCENESECKTIKLNLPSEGLKIKYIDINTNNELCDDCKIEGNINDEYDISDKIKNIDGYKLINDNYNKYGKLKKDLSNIVLKYAKEKDVIVQYLDNYTNKKIKEDKILKSYEGEKIKINIPSINKYQFKNGDLEYTVKNEGNIAKLYYSKINSGDNIKMSNKTNKNENSDNNKTIMDEIIDSFFEENEIDELLKESIIYQIPSKQEYEILMNCDESDYIIYYKKQ